MIKNISIRVLCILGCIGFVGYWTSSEVLAIEAYFDTEISTKLDVQKDVGTLVIKRLDEELPQVFPDITYEQRIFVEIILDASKTMGEPDMTGLPKIEIAKKIVAVLVNYFPQRDTHFALRVNGAKYANNCLDSEMVIPFRKQNGPEILDAIKNLQAKGLSPLAYSIRQILQDFSGTIGTKIVFVITDGLETCDTEPVDPCTTTMDIMLEAEFEGSLNIIGISTVYEDARQLLSCLAARGNGEFLDTNRDNSAEFAQLIRRSSQLRYSISKILDVSSLAEGKILELYNRRIGDFSVIEGERSVLKPEQRGAYSSHELQAGVYKVEFATVPPLASYFTIDRKQQFTIGILRSGNGLDLYDRAHLSLGNKYYDNEQIKEALAEYQKVAEFDNRNVDAHLNMGIIYDDIYRDKAKAAEHYKAYLELQGPRQEEVRGWLRKVRGEPTEEEKLQEKAREREEEKARAEAERRAAEEAAQRQKEYEQQLEIYNEIYNANILDIVHLSEEEVLTGDIVRVIVSDTTTDSKAQSVADNVSRRIRERLNRNPEVIVYRENKPEEPIARAGGGGAVSP